MLRRTSHGASRHVIYSTIRKMLRDTSCSSRCEKIEFVSTFGRDCASFAPCKPTCDLCRNTAARQVAEIAPYDRALMTVCLSFSGELCDYCGSSGIDAEQK